MMVPKKVVFQVLKAKLLKMLYKISSYLGVDHEMDGSFDKSSMKQFVNNRHSLQLLHTLVKIKPGEPMLEFSD